ncbi:cytosine/adenosine deaminase-related metal-dependent hydrolase [Clostridium tetanomorphum]|nr:putative amidohydrolase [Clostridium tetanomorphum DSM 665]MBP1864093.1 cytosine/adenosine deaminase-related metal-dependent hydrolase [Clostridium tetanomorphum]NRS84506.1 cytosine/adenosine deaminase-related metal-dependent hydrolase [Clostridium tetanomorphum]NRZ97720.1 cytosine/adenosine deaminase-related metal-dependent hydrolase [Clostridium tetanomorphum]SQB91998.1 amidohydrolase family protein [Clostridium tetanomorphum]
MLIHDPIANIVYSMHSTNIESTMCNGRWIMKDRKITFISEENVLNEAVKMADSIRKRSGIILPNRFPTIR